MSGVNPRPWREGDAHWWVKPAPPAPTRLMDKTFWQNHWVAIVSAGLVGLGLVIVALSKAWDDERT